jgi:hypothetical protein
MHERLSYFFAYLKNSISAVAVAAGFSSGR